MAIKKASQAHVKKERDPQKVERVLKQKGYKSGNLPKSKVLHHVMPVSQGGKTTAKNTRVITQGKHKQIHKNRKLKGLE